MEQLKNSVFVDAKMFPKVDVVTILDARPFLNARLRGAFTPGKTLRLDTAYVSWDQVSVLGRLPQLLMALIIPQRPGLTLLRQYLGSEIDNFANVVLDPAQPDIVTLIGPRRMPSVIPPTLDVVTVEDALRTENFKALHGTTKAVVGLLSYIQTRSPEAVGEKRHSLGNGWSLLCTTLEGGQSVFTLLEHAPAEEPEPETLAV